MVSRNNFVRFSCCHFNWRRMEGTAELCNACNSAECCERRISKDSNDIGFDVLNLVDKPSKTWLGDSRIDDSLFTGDNGSWKSSNTEAFDVFSGDGPGVDIVIRWSFREEIGETYICSGQANVSKKKVEFLPGSAGKWKNPIIASRRFADEQDFRTRV